MTPALPDCDRTYVCTRESTSQAPSWQLRETHDAVCDGCPANVPQEGAACTTTDAICTHYEGTCGCVAGTWKCTRPEAGCPARRPRLGSSCVHEMTCDFGTCLFGRRVAYACKTRVMFVTAWKEAMPEACP